MCGRAVKALLAEDVVAAAVRKPGNAGEVVVLDWRPGDGAIAVACALECDEGEARLEGKEGGLSGCPAPGVVVVVVALILVWEASLLAVRARLAGGRLSRASSDSNASVASARDTSVALSSSLEPPC